MRDDGRQELEGTLLLHLRFLGGEMDLVNHALGARFGLSRTAMRALERLHRRGTHTAGELADALHLTTGATTSVIDSLVQTGHAERLSDPGDRRRTVVRATETSSAEARRSFLPFRKAMLDLLGTYSVDELRLLVGFLEATRREVAAHAGRLEERPVPDDAQGPH